MGERTDWGTLPSLPRCSDERRDWIAAGCDHHSLRQSNRCTRPGKAAAMAGSPSSRYTCLFMTKATTVLSVRKLRAQRLEQEKQISG